MWLTTQAYIHLFTNHLWGGHSSHPIWVFRYDIPDLVNIFLDTVALRSPQHFSPHGKIAVHKTEVNALTGLTDHFHEVIYITPKQRIATGFYYYRNNLGYAVIGLTFQLRGVFLRHPRYNLIVRFLSLHPFDTDAINNYRHYFGITQRQNRWYTTAVGLGLIADQYRCVSLVNRDGSQHHRLRKLPRRRAFNLRPPAPGTRTGNTHPYYRRYPWRAYDGTIHPYRRHDFT